MWKNSQERTRRARLGQGVAHSIVGLTNRQLKACHGVGRSISELYLTLGWHPLGRGVIVLKWRSIYEQLKHPKVVTRRNRSTHWMTAPKMSRKGFRRQIQLSKDLDLPFVVHTRDALRRYLCHLQRVKVGPRGGIMHSFSGEV